MNQLFLNFKKAENIPVFLGPDMLLDFRTQQIEFSELANQRLGLDSQCEFGLVSNSEDWDGVRQLRLKMYLGKRDYLGSLIDQDGIDVYDNHSYLFYAKLNGKYVASVRFTRYPFETSEYFNADDLDAFLGRDYQHHYLEVGRLVADSSAKVSNLSQAILAYSIAMATSIQTKTRYLAYSHPRLKQKTFRYNQEEQTQSFYIPERRDSKYILFKGCMKQELESLKRSVN